MWKIRCNLSAAQLVFATNGARKKLANGATRHENSYKAEARFWPMDEPSDNSDSGVDTSVTKAVSDFVAALSDEHRMLVVLKAQLYGGSWEPMIDDLQNRLEGKPYIFKLVNRIKDDIERIERMQEFEQEHHVDLAEHVELP